METDALPIPVCYHNPFSVMMSEYKPKFQGGGGIPGCPLSINPANLDLCLQLQYKRVR